MKRKTGLETIFEVSSELFSQKGYDEVTIDEICSAVGISKPTLYAQKLTKRDLFIHMYKPKREEVFIEQKVCDVNNIMAEIYRSVDLIAERVFCHGPDLLRVLLRLHLQKPALGEVMDREWRERLAQLIHAAQIRHQIRNDQKPELLVQIIGFYMVGYSFQYSINQAEESREHLHSGVHAILQTEQSHES